MWGDLMDIWWALIFIALGAGISEWYHYRMWRRYQMGKGEGRRYSEDTKQRVSIRK